MNRLTSGLRTLALPATTQFQAGVVRATKSDCVTKTRMNFGTCNSFPSSHWGLRCTSHWEGTTTTSLRKWKLKSGFRNILVRAAGQQPWGPSPHLEVREGKEETPAKALG